ncbi:MAG: hypothetical protein JWO86_5207 [Myxococcaceae bacterium]|nr:hypothetical protein [Myxococcaceae bacterium]
MSSLGLALLIAFTLVSGASGCSADAGPAAAPPAEPTSDAAPPPAPMAMPTASMDAGPPEAAAPPPLDVPASLVTALGGKTYVEESCQTVMHPGWPYPAQKCTYQKNLVVTIANPEPDRVAHWIVEASSLIDALEALRTRDRAGWEAGLKVIAAHTIGQSSRIFPLAGQIFENGTVYAFERGVTSTCSTGCYCRINSTSRPQWCKYAVDVLKTEPAEADCLAKYGQSTSTLTDPWLAHCMDNHVASWTSDRNEHFRAQAWAANALLATKIKDPTTATSAAVIAALKLAYPGG